MITGQPSSISNKGVVVYVLSYNDTGVNLSICSFK